MKLPLPFFSGKKKEIKDYFLALLFRDEEIRAIVFSQIDGKINVIGDNTQELETPLETIGIEKLLETIDKAIGQAESALPENIETHKTIFGLKDSWVDGTTIRKERMDRLKEICKQLDLQPIGFLVFQEAIAHLLQKEEGAPVSAVLVEAGKSIITVSLLRAGRIVEVQSGVLDDSMPKTIEKILKGFQNAEILPSRIIVLDTQDRKELSQKLLHYSWSSTIPFLHVPQVTVLGQEFDGRAVLYGTASQMGFDAQDLPRIRPATDKTVVDKQEKSEDPEQKGLESMNTELIKEDVNKEGLKEKVEEKKEGVEETKEERFKEKLAAQDLGFVKDQDVLEMAPKEIHGADTKNMDENIAEIPEEVKEQEEAQETNISILPEGMQQVFTGVRKNLKLPGISLLFLSNAAKTLSKFMQGPKVLLIIPSVIVLAIVGFVWYIFSLHATVTLVMDPKTNDQTQNITFAPDASSDFGKNIIGATSVSVSEDGSVDGSATGKKDIGDKAKGTVTIYNNDDTSHTITAGTTITSQNGLKFITANDITVASASGDIFSGTKPGTQTVDVSAVDIGTEYNLPSGTKFAIGSSLVLAAKNDNAFSGGSKKTITVVSQDDLDSITKSLTDKLQDKAKSDIAQKSSDGKTILPMFLKTDLTKKNFSKQIGDEATSLSLDGTINYETLSYSKEEMDTFAKQFLQDKIPNAMHLSPNGLKEDISDISVGKDGTVTAVAKIHASFLPTIDTAQAAKAIAGKSYTDIKSSLSLPDLLSAQVRLSPNLFFLPHILPRISSHIQIVVTSNE